MQNLKDLKTNREYYISDMMQHSDNFLSRNLDIIQKQMEKAFVTGDIQAMEVLQERESQIIEARCRINFPES